MTPTLTPTSAEDFLVATGVRRLDPASTHIFSGSYSLLHCKVGDELFRAVFAIFMLPVTYPDRFVSLRYIDVADDKVQEIGVIGDLREFPPDQQQLIRSSLAKQYHENTITRVYAVRCEFGLLFFDVETERGRAQFMMPWRYDRADDFGANGKVLLDALDNRYLIPNIEALPPKERRNFTTYIYW